MFDQHRQEADERGADQGEPVMVVLQFTTDRPDALFEVLSHYVVASRGAEGARNIDLVASATTPGRVLVVEKWDSARAQRAHFDSAEMVEMARACADVLTTAPDIDLFHNVSMHDLA
ncbi:MAG: putative quinol monooxygenase [Acidimicrobiales bacterium]